MCQMTVRGIPNLLPLSVALVLWDAGPALCVEARTYDMDDFASWSYPEGLVSVTAAGIEVKRFQGVYNAVADMDGYASSTIGVHGTRPLRSPTNEATLGLLADQNPDTWWQPAPDAPLEKRWVELDLGRAVVAHKLRVHFPDTEGARPYEYFSVYVSPGIALRTAPEQIRFTRVGAPVTKNRERMVEFDLFTVDQAAATGQHLVTRDTLDFELVRFVRFEAGAATPEAAVAEIEVITAGVNLATKVATEDRLAAGFEVWGGRTWTSNVRDCPACGKASGAEGLIDGDLGGRYWTIEAEGATEWRQWGNWMVIDFGQTFRLNRLVWLPNVLDESPLLYGFDRQRQSPWYETDFLLSDGSHSNSADPQVEGPYQYELLSTIDNTTAPAAWLFDLQFPPQDTRLLLWRRMNRGVSNYGKWGRALQLFAFCADGYPAAVSLESDDMDLGSAFSIRRVEWDADLPPGTRIDVFTQTGNGYQTIKRWFLANGVEVTQAAWEAAKQRQRGEVIEDQVRDQSWSEWSRPHRFSGQEFQSPSPRRWLRVRLTLQSEDPELFPKLRSLSFITNEPVVHGGLSGALTPRSAPLDESLEFRYTVWVDSPVARDEGFDRILINVPPEATDTELVEALVGGVPVAATARIEADSLLSIALPGAPVTRDSVEVRFRTRLFRSPTVFDAAVYNSAQTAEFVVRLAPDSEATAARVFDVLELDVPGLARDLTMLGVRVDGRLAPLASGRLADPGRLEILLGESVPAAAALEITFESRMATVPGHLPGRVYAASNPGTQRAVNGLLEARLNIQGIIPRAAQMNQVHVPEVENLRRLVHDLQYRDVLTPNADGINDSCPISFTVLKTPREPRVRVFDLGGQLVTELSPRAAWGTAQREYAWDGKRPSGELVPPGVYVLHIQVRADAGDQQELRLVHVAY